MAGGSDCVQRAVATGEVRHYERHALMKRPQLIAHFKQHISRRHSFSRGPLPVVLVSVIVLTATAYGCKSSADTSQRPEANAEKVVTADSGNVKVTVSDHGFVPSSIQAKRGQPLTLEFTRVSDQTCAKQVAFPELNLTKDLPLNTVVTIQVPTDVARTLTFQCGMGMYKSSVVIL